MKYQQIEDARYIVDAYQIRGTNLESNTDCPAWVRNAIDNHQLLLEADGTYTIENTNCYGIEVGSFLIRVVDKYIVSMTEECFLSHYKLQPETKIVNSEYTVEDLLYNATDVCIHVPGEILYGSKLRMGMGEFICLKISNQDILNSVFSTTPNTPMDKWLRFQFETNGICVYPLADFGNVDCCLHNITTELAYQYIMINKAYQNTLMDINNYITKIGGRNNE